MNKKGFLLAESTLKVIIAILVIILLVFFLNKLYSSLTRNQKLEEARMSLDNIKAGLDEAKEKGESEVVILYPTEGFIRDKVSGQWWIIGFPLEQKGEIIRPNTCILNDWANCLCICMTSPIRGRMKYTADNCDSGWGECIGIEDVFVNPDGIHRVDIRNTPFNLEIKYINNKFEIRRK